MQSKIGSYTTIFTAFIFILLTSCSGGKKGFFGFGKDSLNIRTYSVSPIFSSNDKIFWVYQLKSLSSPNLYGIKLERNELGWLNLQTISLKVDTEFKVLSGHYPPLKPGLYRITIYHNMNIFDQGMFRIISE